MAFSWYRILRTSPDDAEDAPNPEEPPPPRRHGLLPILSLLLLLTAFVALPTFREALFSFLGEFILLVLCLPTTIACAALLLTYVATICLRPNSLGPLDWYSAALLQAQVAAILALFASPLLGQIAEAWFGITDETSLFHVFLGMPLVKFEPAWSRPRGKACGGCPK